VKKIDNRYLRILDRILDRLKPINAPWAITGSFGFALQGVPVKPHDIDVQTDEMGAYEIERLLTEFVVERVHFASAENIRSHFGVLNIDGIKVDIMGDIQKRLDNGTWTEAPDLGKHIHFVKMEKMNIPVLSLEYEYEAYMQLGRKDKATLLKRWLLKHSNALTEDNDE